jgi:hypothetical protein
LRAVVFTTRSSHSERHSSWITVENAAQNATLSLLVAIYMDTDGTARSMEVNTVRVHFHPRKEKLYHVGIYVTMSPTSHIILLPA